MSKAKIRGAELAELVTELRRVMSRSGGGRSCPDRPFHVPSAPRVSSTTRVARPIIRGGRHSCDGQRHRRRHGPAHPSESTSFGSRRVGEAAIIWLEVRSGVPSTQSRLRTETRSPSNHRHDLYDGGKRSDWVRTGERTEKVPWWCPSRRGLWSTRSRARPIHPVEHPAPSRPPPRRRQRIGPAGIELQRADRPVGRRALGTGAARSANGVRMRPMK